MTFDATRFLTAMFQVFLECRDDGEDRKPKEMLENRPAMRFAVRRELRRQAKRQGANPRERRVFAANHLEEAIKALEREVESNF